MDRLLDNILDKYFPYTDDELAFGANDKRQIKREIRLRVEKVVKEYIEAKKDKPDLPSLNIDEIFKRLKEGN